MKMNPIYKRETMVSARSFRLALVLLAFNGILALVALLNMYSTLAQVRLTAEIQYSSFLNLYMFVAILEFIMLIFIMPALTAGSICGERERRTLELMMTTKLTPADIVIGKLMASLSTMGLLVLSSLPVFATVFVYGGVTLKDVAWLLLCYCAAALFAGSLGICCSAVFHKTTLSTVAAYGLLVLVVLGTLGINQFALYMNRVHADAYLVSAGQTAAQVTSGNFLYLLLLNPVATLVMTLLRLAGQNQTGMMASNWLGNHQMNVMESNWIGVSIAVQLCMAAIFIAFAVRALQVRRR